MSDKKICPLRTKYVGEGQECLEEKCAWWETRLEMCSLRAIARESSMKLIARNRE